MFEYASPSIDPNERIQEQLVFDTVRDHYQILALGWEGEKRVYFTLLHIDLVGEKIWIQENNTDFDIAEKLVAMGVPKSDIVLAFHAPSMRPFTGYAVA
ncbi:MAG TPA: XisI protein [Saprospiraceae bacterium]|nr:XisI protein [Saprospiraceae bacterium]HMQ82255.1 XisI protein [Saprospiraceae bacterium]